MSPENVKKIDEDAIKGILPKPFTVQALCATIRMQDRAIEEQRQVIMALREQIRAVAP